MLTTSRDDCLNTQTVSTHIHTHTGLNFLSVVSRSFMTPLHVAAERAHNDILEVLQKHGAKVCCCVLSVRVSSCCVSCEVCVNGSSSDSR